MMTGILAVHNLQLCRVDCDVKLLLILMSLLNVDEK